MAGRTKLPVDVVKARGKTNITKKEYECRKECEPDIPLEYRIVQTPEYLFAHPNLVERFDHYTKMLGDIMPDNFGQPDAACLARYVVEEYLFERLTADLINYKSPTEIKALHLEQNRALKNAQALARDLGLTVTSRCKLVVQDTGDTYEDDGL